MDQQNAEVPPVPNAYDWEEFRKNGYKTIDFIADHFKDVDARKVPVQPRVKPGFLKEKVSGNPDTAPEDGTSWDAVLDEVKTAVCPGLTHWSHPDFYAYFPAMVSPPALLGDMLANAFNNPGFNWVSCPAATETEVLVMDWLAKAFGLPEHFLWSGSGGGVMQPSATEAMIVVMLAARVAAQSAHPDMSPVEVGSKLVAYYSDQAHFCVEKAIKVLSIPHARKLATARDPKSEWGNFPIDAADLRAQVEKDKANGLIPFFVSGNFGATGICAIDPLEEMGAIAKEHGMWFNCDAAYAGVVSLCPEFRHMTSAGFGLVDSLLVNGSKWFSTLFNTNFMFFKDKSFVVRSLNASGVYLANTHTESGSVVDFKDYHLGLGRPFRSLKMLTTLRSFGLNGLRAVIRRHCVLAKRLSALFENDSRFVVPVKPLFGLVCVTIKDKSNEFALAMLERLNASEKAFLVHTMLDGVVVIRISLAHPRLEAADIQALFEMFGKEFDATTAAA